MPQHSRWDEVRARAGAGSTPESRTRMREARQDLEFGALIYRMRSAAGLTQAELARRMGTTQAAISRLEEGGGSNHRLETLRKLAAAVDRHLVVSFPAGDYDDDRDDAIVLQ